MIKVLIIEDEIPARKKLIRFLNDIEELVEIVAEIDTIEDAITFLNTYQVDVIFSDIELLDGQAFEIYNQVEVNCPIIFTTAYDKFWMNAFETNGIEYLLKPFSFIRFQKAWSKFLKFKKTEDSDLVSKLSNLINITPVNSTYKKRFIINTNNSSFALEIEKIIFFSADEGVIFAHETSGKKHLLTESTLISIETQIDPNEFFKINRGQLVAKQYIEKIGRYSKNALSIKIINYKTQLITSQSNTATFREWFEK
jgi:DNA-binding LytR/AlgR family response regulator